MSRRLIGLTAAGALAIGAFATPTPSAASPVIIPWIIAAGVGGLVIGAVAANAAEQNAIRERGTVTVGPDRPLSCHFVRQQTRRGMQRVQVCD